MKQYHIIVGGHVQGVGFRYFTHAAALELGIKGWVRNTEDGSVEIVAEGKENSLGAFLAKIQAGPRFSSVSEVNWNEKQADISYSSFTIKN
ncbi:acylphosphatase [Bacillus sp. OV322]|uniref:acylphosphatase n=1 Tax=Bacillus sp. OV322 TaxID=1882764 RepID=UPI0008E3FED7|nr:acylphosphatase [Bacillus sp. OV322]SFC86583.1 acylphosphatase [Bacillus sp. OV322]